MSRNSDTRRLLNLARSLGLEVVALKHGGHGIYAGDGVRVTTIPANGHGRRGWVKRVQRELGAR